MSSRIWRIAFFAALMEMIGQWIWGQEIHFKTRTVVTGPSQPGQPAQPRPDGRLAPPGPRSRPRTGGGVHQIIQFDHTPGIEDLDALAAAGLKVVAVVPDNAVMVLAPREGITNRDPGMSWVGELEPDDKLSPDLATTDSIQAIVEFHGDVDTGVQESVVAAQKVTLQRPAGLLRGHVIINTSREKLHDLANRDEVAYIFPADPALLLSQNDLMHCEGMLTMAGSVAQYSSVAHPWDLDSDHVARLGYGFGAMTSKVPASTIQSEVFRALQEWSRIASIVFEPAVSATALKTIMVKFVSGPHGDSYPFDGPGGVLGHTFYPVPVNPESIAGDMHLDADENWHAGGDLDIYSVVLHEAGHALGLGHSDKPGDVMYPYYRRNAQLSANDIGAIQGLYGKPNAPLAPPAPAAPSPSSPLSLTLNPVSPPGQSPQVSIAGSFSGGVPPVTVQWQNDRGYTGKGTAASGAWSASGITLVTGANTLTVTAVDSARHTVSQSASITRSQAPAGLSPISISITSPASAVVTAKAATLSVSGTAAGGSGVTQVTWQTLAGTSGIASGAEHWSVSSVPLLVGTNTIIVRAFDANGLTAWASVVAVRQ